MAEPIVAIVETFETKRIEELVSLAKLNGKEELLIDNGDTTLKVTVDTLLGYIRDQINSASGGGTGGVTPSNPEPILHFISSGSDDIPSESRPEGHYYIRSISTVPAQNTPIFPG